jgi:uncharacterized membrane protein
MSNDPINNTDDVFAKTESTTNRDQLIGAIVFIASILFSAIGYLSFKDGAWLLLLIGIVMIVVLMSLSKIGNNDSWQPLYAQKAARSMVYGLGLISVIAFIVWLFNVSLGNSNIHREEAASYQPRADSSTAEIMCKNYVLKNLRAPATAVFPRSADNTSQNANTYRVVSHVDSQNGAGENIRSHYDCVVGWNGQADASSDNWELLSLAIN